MRLASIVLLTLLLPCAPVGAQPAPARATDAAVEAAILEVVDKFMLAVSASDMAAMAALRVPGSTNTVSPPGPDGRPQVVVRPGTGGPPMPAGLRERYWDPTVLVRGPIAVVWAPYEFWRDGKTTHCGIDVFDMVQQEGRWLIGNMMWTVEPDACPALRPADPSRIRPR